MVGPRASVVTAGVLVWRVGTVGREAFAGADWAWRLAVRGRKGGVLADSPVSGGPDRFQLLIEFLAQAPDFLEDLFARLP